MDLHTQFSVSLNFFRKMFSQNNSPSAVWHIVQCRRVQFNLLTADWFCWCFNVSKALKWSTVRTKSNGHPWQKMRNESTKQNWNRKKKNISKQSPFFTLMWLKGERKKFHSNYGSLFVARPLSFIRIFVPWDIFLNILEIELYCDGPIFNKSNVSIRMTIAWMYHRYVLWN